MILPSRYAHERDAGYVRRMNFSVTSVVAQVEIVTTFPFGRPRHTKPLRPLQSRHLQKEKMRTRKDIMLMMVAKPRETGKGMTYPVHLCQNHFGPEFVVAQ